jgi:hypothetical protein
MRRRWLTVYTGIMAAVMALAIVSAVQAYHRADAGSRWTREATQWKATVATAEKADALALARNKAATAATDRLTRRVNDTTKAIATQIERTRKLKRKIVTGSTIVSYVNAPTKAG